ncbi:MAG: MBL fold metallo-hydrolase [Candidatus Limnocylindrales bacterium]
MTEPAAADARLPAHLRGWVEIGDRVFVRRYRFVDQNIGVVLGDGETLVVDSRSSPRQAAELIGHIRELRPGAADRLTVVNTHGHWDHAFGNHAFRPAAIWGHERCATMIAVTGELQRASIREEMPEYDEEFAEVELDPPDRTFATETTIEVGGRPVDLRYLGRAHTDNDIAIVVPDARVVLAGDLLENGATPYFGDGWPMDWPETADRLAALVPTDGTVVPGHGDHAGRAFALDQARAIRTLTELASHVWRDELSLDEAIARSPFPSADSREPLERAVAQLRGEIVAAY